MNDKTNLLKKYLGQLFMQSLNQSDPLYHLELMRQKLEGRSFQDFDKEDILSMLGKLQQCQGRVHSEMLRIHDLLKQQDQ
jgi:hypothetical protein